MAVALRSSKVQEHPPTKYWGRGPDQCPGPDRSAYQLPEASGFSCDDTGAFLAGIQSLCMAEDLTIQTHQVGRAITEKFQFSVYDAVIVAAALIAGCTTLWCEDMHDGLLVEEQLRIINPFS